MPSEVDTSIYKGIGGGPLTSMSPGSLVDLVRSIQTLKGQQQAGQLIQQNTDPNGVFNSSGAMAGIGQVNPLVVPQAVQNIQTLQQNQQSIGIQQRDTANRIVGSTLLNPNDQSLTNSFIAIGQAIGVPASVVKNRVFPNGIPTDPQQRAAAIRDFAFQSLGPSPLLGQQDLPIMSGPNQAQTKAVPVGQIYNAQIAGGGAGGGNNVITAPSPMQTQSAQDMPKALAAQSNFTREMTPYNEMNRILRENPNMQFGPTTPEFQHLQEALYAMSPDVATRLGVDPQKIKSYGEFSKWAPQAVAQGSAGFLPHSNEGLATFTAANPNVNMNRLTNEELVPSMAALRRADYLRDMAARDGVPAMYGMPAIQGGSFNFNNARPKISAMIDPRALAISFMPPDKATKAIANLKPSERKSFNWTYELARRYPELQSEVQQ